MSPVGATTNWELRKWNILAAGGLRYLRDLRKPILDEIEKVLPQMLEIRVIHGIRGGKPFGERLVAEMASGPMREVVPELGMIERRAQQRIVEVVRNALLGNPGDMIAQLPQILSAPSERADQKRAIHDPERRRCGFHGRLLSVRDEQLRLSLSVLLQPACRKGPAVGGMAACPPNPGAGLRFSRSFHPSARCCCSRPQGRTASGEGGKSFRTVLVWPDTCLWENPLHPAVAHGLHKDAGLSVSSL